MRFPRLQPGDRLTAELVNRMLEALEMLTGMTADASSGIELVRSAGNMSLRLNDNAGRAADDSAAAFVAVTSSTADPTSGMYPGYVLEPSDGDPVTVDYGDACWVYDPAQNSSLVDASGVVDGGDSYEVGDVLTVEGGTSDSPCQLIVTDVDDDGVIIAADVYDGGDYSVQPDNPVTVTGGGGEGATFDLTFGSGGLETGEYVAAFALTHSDGLPVYLVVAPESVGGGAPLRVTSTTPDETSQMYPAKLQEATDGTPVRVDDGGACWVIFPPGQAAQAGYYDAAFLLTHDDDGRGVYLACAVGGGGGGGPGSGAVAVFASIAPVSVPDSTFVLVPLVQVVNTCGVTAGGTTFSPPAGVARYWRVEGQVSWDGLGPGLSCPVATLALTTPPSTLLPNVNCVAQFQYLGNPGGPSQYHAQHMDLTSAPGASLRVYQTSGATLQIASGAWLALTPDPAG